MKSQIQIKHHEYELDPLGSSEHTILASNFQTVFACFDTFDSLHRDRRVMICHALRRLNLTHFIVKLFHCDLLSNGMYLVLQCVFHRLFDVYLSSFVDLLLVFFLLKFFFFSLLFAIFLISSLEISYFFFLRLAMCALICFSNRIAALFMFMCIVLRISFFSFSFKALFHRIYCDFAHKPIMKSSYNEK